MKKTFDCAMCGQCCQGGGGIVASLNEQEAMAGFMGMALPDFQDAYISRTKDKCFVKTDSLGFCLFFAREKGCAVHPVKPGTCRAWPFFRGNLMDESSFEMAREYCPGISREVTFDQFVRDGLLYLKQHNLSCTKGSSTANALDLEGIKG